jgi:plastocyanin
MARLVGHPVKPLACLLLLGITLAACGGDGDGGTPPPTTTIAKASVDNGDAQTGTVGEALATPLQVLVSENGTPASGTTVTWSTASGGSLSPTSAATDANGLASSTWTLGPAAGSQSAQATLSGAAGSPVVFSGTAAAGTVSTLSPAGGDGQNGAINTQLPQPVQAKVSDDFGNGIEGVSVAWAATGATVSAPTVVSDPAGISAVNVTLGATAGPIIITATAGDLAGSPLTFTATALAGPAPGPTVQVLNNRFDPVSVTITAPATVTWSWPAGSMDHNVVPDNGTTPASSGALADGPRTYSFSFTTPGTYRYYCANHGGPAGSGMSGTITVQ